MAPLGKARGGRAGCVHSAEAPPLTISIFNNLFQFLPLMFCILVAHLEFTWRGEDRFETLAAVDVGSAPRKSRQLDRDSVRVQAFSESESLFNLPKPSFP